MRKSTVLGAPSLTILLKSVDVADVDSQEPRYSEAARLNNATRIMMRDQQ
jgi:hypothetical protein